MGRDIPAEAQQPIDDWPGAGSVPSVLQPFQSIFQETEAERLALEKVAIEPAEERRIGDAQLNTYLASLKQRQIRVFERGRDVEYVRALVELVRGRMKRGKQYPKIRVLVADTESTDARAFPGGAIVVMTGLLNFAESEAAMVGVLGHELSHIDHGHQLRQVRAIAIASDAWRGANLNLQDVQDNVVIMARNVARPFHADDEAAADADGARWAFELGYEPLELARLFETLRRRDERGVNGGRQNVPGFLRSHPSYENRLASIRGLAVELQRDKPGDLLYVGRANLRQRVARAEREFAE
jgi:predicted Zn-dependent protease